MALLASNQETPDVFDRDAELEHQCELAYGELTRLNSLTEELANLDILSISGVKEKIAASSRRMRPSDVAKLFDVHRNTISAWIKGEGDPPEGFAAAYSSGDAADLAELSRAYSEVRLCRRDAMSASKKRLFDD